MPLHACAAPCINNLSKQGCTVEWAALADEARTLHEVVLTRSMWDLLTDSSLAPALKALEIEMKLQRERAQHERAVAMRK